MWGKGTVESPRAVERRIIEQTSEALVASGIPRRQARQLARSQVNTAKESLRKNGDGDWMYHSGLGDRMLTDGETSEEVRELLEARRRHGVTEEDFRRWHNLPLLERTVLIQQDVAMTLAAFRSFRDQGKTDEEAARSAARAHAQYTQDVTKIPDGDPDALLPAELKLRVNDVRMAKFATEESAAKFVEELQSSSSFNAWVRAQIEAGEL